MYLGIRTIGSGISGEVGILRLGKSSLGELEVRHDGDDRPSIRAYREFSAVEDRNGLSSCRVPRFRLCLTRILCFSTLMVCKRARDVVACTVC